MKIIRDAYMLQEIPSNIFNKKIKMSQYLVVKEYSTGALISNLFNNALVVLDKQELNNFNLLKEEHQFHNMEMELDLYKQGILIDVFKDEKATILQDMKESSIHSKNADVYTIFPTQQCNAYCAYCFEHNQKKISMTEEVVDATIEYLQQKINPDNRIIFRWFGGEPLLKQDIIGKIINRINDYFYGKLKFQSMITTNGILLSKEVIKNAVHFRNLSSIHLTIDGHGINHSRRKGISCNDGLYNELLNNIDYLLQKRCMVVCRINVDKRNVSQLASICDDLTKFKGNSLFKTDIVPLRGTYEGAYCVDEYSSLYMHAYDVFYEKGLISNYLDLLPYRLHENCIAGVNNSVIIASSGDLYKCSLHATEENDKFGTVYDGITNYDNLDIWSDYRLSEECNQCTYLPICYGGCKHFRLDKSANGVPCRNVIFLYTHILDLIYKEYQY